MPLLDVSGRMRECSAAFYRENPAQIHRLMPWINRELVALFRDNRIQIDLVLNFFPELLTRHDITSPEFRNHMAYWDNERTDHFIHELLNYARSPFDMIGYDRNVRYSPRFNTSNSDVQVVTLSSSENGE
jgi:E3 ubiquitin-protein ligase Topors